MDNRVKQLLEQISALEDELRSALAEQPSAMFFQIRGKRVEFEKSVREAHRKLKTGFFQWLLKNRPQNLITGPIIYAMIVPLVIADVFISFYQFTCFPVYGIKKVRRGDYIIFDRQQLSYLNFIEKFHCSYCAYASGLLGYISEIVARTEQYFCPIKHARKVLGSHARYARFLDYGDAEDYQARLEAFRTALAKEK